MRIVTTVPQIVPALSVALPGSASEAFGRSGFAASQSMYCWFWLGAPESGETVLRTSPAELPDERSVRLKIHRAANRAGEARRA